MAVDTGRSVGVNVARVRWVAGTLLLDRLAVAMVFVLHWHSASIEQPLPAAKLWQHLACPLLGEVVAWTNRVVTGRSASYSPVAISV
jgi:hypothetical protein